MGIVYNPLYKWLVTEGPWNAADKEDVKLAFLVMCFPKCSMLWNIYQHVP